MKLATMHQQSQEPQPAKISSTDRENPEQTKAMLTKTEHNRSFSIVQSMYI